MKKLLAILSVLALFAGVFALSGHAAGGNSLAVAFGTAETGLLRGTAFTVDVKLTPTGGDVSALRLYVLYDSACFTWDPATTVQARPGMFGKDDGAGGAKYPAAMGTADRAKYSVAVVQWCAVPAGGAPPLALSPGIETTVLTLGFQVRADAPYAAPGGRIFVSTDYSLADTPWFYAADLGIDATAADLTIQPVPPVPALETDLTIDGNYIYGFPESLPRVGNPTCWSDSMLGNYFTATDEGILELARPADCPLTGTGTVLQLWNAAKTVKVEYTLIVFGDVDGNFVVDYDDWAALPTLYGPVGTDPFRFAADLDGNGVVDAADRLILLEAARGAAAIPQTRPIP